MAITGSTWLLRGHAWRLLERMCESMENKLKDLEVFDVILYGKRIEAGVYSNFIILLMKVLKLYKNLHHSYRVMEISLNRFEEKQCQRHSRWRVFVYTTLE